MTKVNESTPNYQETELTGSKYKRAYKIEINNPKDAKPSLYIHEQDCIKINDEIIYRNAGSLYTALDSENALHMEIYEKINELYIQLREARDNA